MTDGFLVIWTVYENPTDFPGEFVARPHFVGRGGGKPVAAPHAIRAKTLAELRAKLPPGLILFPRDKSDPPQIVESWM